MLIVPGMAASVCSTWAARRASSSRLSPKRRTAIGASTGGPFSNSRTRICAPGMAAKRWRKPVQERRRAPLAGELRPELNVDLPKIRFLLGRGDIVVDLRVAVSDVGEPPIDLGGGLQHGFDRARHAFGGGD